MQPHEIYSLRARDIMNRQFVLVSPLESVHDAIAKMKDCGACQAAIVDRVDEDDAYGIVTYQEVVYQVVAKSLSPNRTRVGEIMTKPLIVVNPTLRLPFIAQLFARFHIQNAIVIDEHRLVGILSSSDLVMALATGNSQV